MRHTEPEWIKQLQVVNDNSTKNKNLKWNKGHLLHQFTYFNGEVNFYLKLVIKKVSIMNTGDSMFISPYVPHTFTSRNQEFKCTYYSGYFFRQNRYFNTE